MQEFVRRAGLADSLGPTSPRFIHVAGTNGKGSVTAFLQSMLVEGGYRTGAFFSPFVVDPRERVQFGRSLISREDLASLTRELRDLAESFTETEFGGITEFEFKTALGFLYWKRKACEWVALEVGLGGRLDATNVVTPAASVIVSIGLDHMAILGETRELIATEKAGIIKPRVPAVVGRMAPEALSTIEAIAAEREAPLWRFGREIVLEGTTVSTPAATHHGLIPGFQGAIQPHNMALAVAALDAAGLSLSSDDLVRGAMSAWAPGRLQEVRFGGTKVILDGAHNPDAAQVLRASLSDLSSVVMVTNMIAGHEPDAFFSQFADLAVSTHVVPIDFHRARPVEATVEVLKPLLPRVQGHSSVLEGLRAACSEAGKDGVVLVTGSFYLVGEALRAMTSTQGKPSA